MIDQENRTHSERRKALYNSMDAKIQAASAIWAQAQAFPTVEKNLGTTSFFAERAALQKPFFDYLSQKKGGLISNLAFEDKLYEGSGSAARRRADIRSTLNHHGGNWHDPQTYINEVPDIFSPLFANTVKVVPGRFSMSLIIPNPFYSSFLKTINFGPSSGIHVPFSWINFISSKPFDFETNSPLHLREQEALDHEDFHSFVEGFRYPYENPKCALENPVSAINQAILKAKSMDKNTLAKTPFELGVNLKKVVDKSHEELIAELVSSNSGELPKRTFSNHMQFMRSLLVKEVSPKGRAKIAIAQYGDYLDIERYRDLINDLFSDTLVIGKEFDFLTALAIFPPSQMRHVKRLVEHWVQST